MMQSKGVTPANVDMPGQVDNSLTVSVVCSSWVEIFSPHDF